MSTHLAPIVENNLNLLLNASDALSTTGKVGFTSAARFILLQLAKEAYNAGATDTAASANTPADPAPAPEVEPSTPTE